MRKLSYPQTGFTLLELIITIIVIGILASLAFQKYIKTVQQSADKEAYEMISQIRQAEEAYYLQTGRYHGSQDLSQLGLESFSLTDQYKFFYRTFETYTPATGYRGYGITACRKNPSGDPGSPLYALKYRSETGKITRITGSNPCL